MKNNKSKLWLYYCKRLREKPAATLFWLAYSLFSIRGGIGVVVKIKENSQSWREYLPFFWLIFLLQAVSLSMVTSNLVSKIVKPNVKKGDGDDAKVLTLTPGIAREAIIFDKYKAIATYFFLINLLLNLPIFFYFLSLSLMLIAFYFLLLNLVFVLVNFLLLVPLIFWLSEGGWGFFVYFFVFFATFSIILLSYLLLGKVFFEYPLLFPSLYFPLSGLVGYLFFSLHRKEFLTKDLL